MKIEIKKWFKQFGKCNTINNKGQIIANQHGGNKLTRVLCIK